jgi:mono/diheme cytochrome c family protein
MTSLVPARAIGLGLALSCAGCDEHQAFHTPRPGLSRMLEQPRGRVYGASTVFADGRTMREPPSDTVPHDLSGASEDIAARHVDDTTPVPVPVTRALLVDGRQRFERVCATCHGILGDGQSVVAEKMDRRKPPSLVEKHRPPGKVFQVVSRGYGFMPSFAAVLTPAERWSVIAYLDALRLSQRVRIGDLSPAMRDELTRGTP